MEITMTVGARYFPQSRTRTAPRAACSKRALAVSPGVCRPRAGRRFHGVLVTMIGIDLPGTDRMRRSASEP